MLGVGLDEGESAPAPPRLSIAALSLTGLSLVRTFRAVMPLVLVSFAVSSLLGPGAAHAASPADVTTDVAAVATTAVTGSTDSALDQETPEREPDSSGLLNVGHVFRFGGTIVGVGSLAALLWVLRSDKEILRLVLSLARMLGLLIATGAALEWASYQQLSGVGLGALVTSTRGWAATLAMLGGILITFGLTERRSLTPVGSTLQWTPGRSSAPGLIGAIAVIASFGFDGHRAGAGPQAALVVADLVHIVAATVWGGGVCVLAIVGLLGARRRRAAGLVPSIVRLSAISPWLLSALVLSGVGLTIVVPGANPNVFATAWGRTLVVKVILVAIAIAIGVYNRVALLPRVRDGDADGVALRQLRAVLAIEAVFILVVIVVAVALVQLVP